LVVEGCGVGKRLPGTSVKEVFRFGFGFGFGFMLRFRGPSVQEVFRFRFRFRFRLLQTSVEEARLRVGEAKGCKSNTKP
jgi:hypothetical protein